MSLDDLRRLYLAWRDAQRIRSSRGELRASAEEREALERFIDAEAECDDRDGWTSLRAEMDRNEDLCACGHPKTHHDGSGSCFHVVGCATACDCGGLRRGAALEKNCAMSAASVLLSIALAAGADPAGVSWRAKIEHYANEHLEHSAWGTAHARRNYRLALALAKEDGVELDEEALFAAALLHDIGAIDGYSKPGVEHMTRGLELVDPILKESGFPMEKLPLVRTIIGNHMYFSEPANLPPTALYFRDADTLDFLGTIGAARIFSLVGRHRWAPDFDGAMATVRKHASELPQKLQTPAGRRLAPARVAEMERFLSDLEREK